MKYWSMALLAGIVLLTSSCGERNGKYTKEYYYRNSHLLRARMEVENKKFNGTGTEYYRSGHVKSEGLYVRNLRHGKHKFYYDSGKIEKEEVYDHGLRTGKYLEFDPEGRKVSEGYYKQDKLDSLWLGFSPEGKVIQKLNFKEGKKDGTQTIFYKDGTVKSVSVYKDGFAGLGLKEYTEDGALINQHAEILFEERNLIALSGTYTVDFSLIPKRKAAFYLEKERDVSFLSVSSYKVPQENGIFRHQWKISPGQYVMTSARVLALTKSALGNELLVARDLNIAAGQ